MLKTLHVSDFGVLGDVLVDFDAGLSCLTGETGAGKSLLVDAIKLLLGARASAGDVRAGAEEAMVEAVFDLGDDQELKALFTQAGYQIDDGEVHVRRTVGADGRGRAWLQGRITTARELGNLIGRLVSVAGQHAFIGLGVPAERLAMLDAFAGVSQEVAAYKKVYSKFKQACDALEELVENQAEIAARRDYLQFVVSSFDTVDPAPGEDQSLASQAAVLENAEHLKTLATSAIAAIYEESPSAHDLLGGAVGAAREMARIDSRVAEIAGRLESVLIDLREIQRDLGSYSESIDVDPGQLQAVHDRLDALRSLARRHGGTLDAAISAAEAARAELSKMDSTTDSVEALQAKADALRSELDVLAAGLTARRTQAATKMSAEVTKVVRSLAMAGATVEIRLSPTEPSESGADRCDFAVETNPGEGWGEVASVASGGELSRITLALYAVLSKTVGTPVMVYDEIDAGVSGGVADQMGQVLNRAGKTRQVLAVTHHGQVAARADAHYLVEKATEAGRTLATIRRLDGEERVQEIARIIGGSKLTETVLKHARELVAG
ncbi:MAG TPA: DNA repair protein RecN [Myxococcota bacterium]|nr:DNA repair protein RecN [Myxococcota bacterium]HPC92334.1 DNA repair protein RecN [Myxococcota bacterium]HPL25716.1 DNA repair protein RecN [Myxococcota bacterium]HQE74153.1 DNA repair protein RecN [Myxococcota bacterium]HQI62160.1 DNA repair protein RecN [Myxococcota bacterium]